MATTLKRPRRASPGRRKPATVAKSAALPDARRLRQRYGLSQALLARVLDVSLRTVSALETAPAPARRTLTQASRLCSALAEAMDPAYVGQWLDQPNDMLAGLKPVEAIERGQLDLVWQVAEGLRSGSQL